jgi:hypothetical protein
MNSSFFMELPPGRTMNSSVFAERASCQIKNGKIFSYGRSKVMCSITSSEQVPVR